MESPKATRPKKMGKQSILRKGGGSGKGGRCGKWGTVKIFKSAISKVIIHKFRYEQSL